MVDVDNRRTTGGTGRKKWLPLAIGAGLLLLLLIFGLRSCSDRDETATTNQTTGTEATLDPATGPLAGTTAGTMGGTATADDGSFTVEGLRGYLSETGPADANGRAFGLDRVTFDTGSATLDQQDQAVIAEVAGVLKQFPNASVTVTGYADPAGDAAANKKLAAQRTTAVKQALAAQGLQTAKLMTNVVGETGNAAVPENRRVELLVKR